MRKVLALVALAGCGDDGGGMNGKIDGGLHVDMMVMPDATPIVEGIWRDTFHTVSGPVTATSSCNNAPAAVSVDPTSATVTQYLGVCKADGTFTIEAPQNLGTYYLKAGGVYYETNKRTGIDLSTDRLGRSDVAAITGVTFDITMGNLQAWTVSDTLAVFGANIGYRQNLNFTSGAPAATNTTVNGSAPWNGYKIDASKSDGLVLVQLAKHTTGGGYDFTSLDRSYSQSGFSMVNNTPQSLSGAFTTGTAGSLTLNIDVASFNQFATVAGPSVTGKTVQGSAYAAISTDTIESPPLISFAQASDGLSTMTFGTVFYGDPFVSTWARLVKIAVAFSVPYTWNGASGTFNAQTIRVVPKATADSTTIVANIGPPSQVMLDGTSALTANSITTVPLVSWSAPTVGNATDYEVQVYEVKTVSTSLTFTSVLRIITKGTSVRIPQGVLFQQRQYIVQVRARNRDAIDVYTTPVRNGATWSASDMLSALVTTN